MGTGLMFRQMAYAGDRDRALALLEEKRTWMPRSGQNNPRGSWTMLASVIEGLTMLGEQSRAADLYPQARDLIDTGAVTIWTISRLTQTVAGMAAAAAHEWESSEQHFHTAMDQAESFPNLLEQAEIRRFRAMTQLDRAAPSDRKRARTLLDKALETYTQIGMPRHIEITRTLMQRTA
jgi:hypothetical protein